jgi:hypothetical protein
MTHCSVLLHALPHADVEGLFWSHSACAKLIALKALTSSLKFQSLQKPEGTYRWSQICCLVRSQRIGDSNSQHRETVLPSLILTLNSLLDNFLGYHPLHQTEVTERLAWHDCRSSLYQEGAVIYQALAYQASEVNAAIKTYSEAAEKPSVGST